MKFTEANLPSNRKFGIFFTSIFIGISFYFFWKNIIGLGTISFVIAALFAIVTIIKDKLLFPLNKLWMRFGFLLGSIISPIFLGIFFYVIFTPLGILLRYFGRDELRLKLSEKESYWRLRNDNIDNNNESFKNQF
mgnify:FL=1|jgi:hypothetical protein